jgi:hypothetical protein
MTMTIDGVPESISRERYLELIAVSGLDINRITQLRFTPAGVYATVYALDESGHPVRSGSDRDSLATHEGFIPVRDA